MPAQKMPTARYAQVKEGLRQAIVSGDWKPGDRVPSEHELTRSYGVSRMTVNRALRELAAEGLIERVQGLGSFVARLHPISSYLQVRDIHDEIAERGHVHATQVLTVGRQRAGRALAAAMGVRSGAQVFAVRLVHRENGIPIQLEERFINPALLPDCLALDFAAATPSHYLFERAPLTEAEQVVEATAADAATAQALGIAAGDPCLLISRRTVSGTVIASVARLIHPGERYRLAGRFKP
jgi:GntR family histidine utilization transcriptional repressor